jgi:hypothetical protein
MDKRKKNILINEIAKIMFHYELTILQIEGIMELISLIEHNPNFKDYELREVISLIREREEQR